MKMEARLHVTLWMVIDYLLRKVLKSIDHVISVQRLVLLRFPKFLQQ